VVSQSQPGLLGWGVVRFLMPLSAFIFLVALFAETNRQPFDMPESEADLVGGFHTEYGAFKWSLFFVAEYAHMIVGSGVFVLLFLGGWNPLPWVPLATVIDRARARRARCRLLVGLLSIGIFLGKVVAMIFFFMWVRWTLPRFRYDQVMKIGWQKLLPLSIANLIFYAIASRSSNEVLNPQINTDSNQSRPPFRASGPSEVNSEPSVFLPWPSSKSNANRSRSPSAPTSRRSSTG
jgi:NADH-quinone oxidoreductase subunit H